MRKRLVLIAIVLLLVASFPSEARKLEFEYDYPVISDRWNVNLGGFLVDLDTTAAFGIGSLAGTVINLENILDLDENQKVIRAEFLFRITEKSALDFGYLAINREASIVLGASDVLDFDGLRFDGNIDSTYNMWQFKTIYKYSFINNGRVNAGISTGFSWFNLQADISGSATLLDENTGQPIGSVSFEAAGTTLLAPVPSLGMFVEYAAAKWFVLRLSGQFFDLEVGDLDFRFSDTSLIMDFYFHKNVGLGIGANTTTMEYRDNGENPVRVDYRFGGILFHLALSF